MLLDVRFRHLDGTTEAHSALDIPEAANGMSCRHLKKLDADGWWRSFQNTDTTDAQGFAVFEEDPTIPKVKNSVPRTLEGTIFDESGAPLASANVALIDQGDGEILGQGSTDEDGYFQFTATTTKDRVSHHYVITRNGISYSLIDGSVVKETEDAKIVELWARP
jgi:hypothetical protein